MEPEERDKARESSSSAASTSSPSSSPAQRQLTPSEAEEQPSVEALHVMQLMSPESAPHGLEGSATPKEIAEFLHEMPHMDPKMIGRVLGEPDERSLEVLQAYANGFFFKGFSLDVALRVYLGRFMLPGEAQKIDRILQAFAKAYFAANPDNKALPSEDAVYTLVFSIVLLNTDAHNPHLAKRFKMTKIAFVRNYQRLLEDDSSDLTHGATVPDQYLSSCYDSFATNPIQWIPRKPDALLPDELELEFPESQLGLEIETSIDGRACLVKKYNNDRHIYSSSSSPSSFWQTWRTNFLSPRDSSSRSSTSSDSGPKIETPSIIGWVVVAVGNDCTKRLGYEMTRYLLKTAPRPVLIRFCEPSVFFSSLED